MKDSKTLQKCIFIWDDSNWIGDPAETVPLTIYSYRVNGGSLCFTKREARALHRWLGEILEGESK